MVTSDTAERLEIPNVPTLPEMEAAILLAQNRIWPAFLPHFIVPWGGLGVGRLLEVHPALLWQGRLEWKKGAVRPLLGFEIPPQRRGNRSAHSQGAGRCPL